MLGSNDRRSQNCERVCPIWIAVPILVGCGRTRVIETQQSENPGRWYTEPEIVRARGLAVPLGQTLGLNHRTGGHLRYDQLHEETILWHDPSCELVEANTPLSVDGEDRRSH